MSTLWQLLRRTARRRGDDPAYIYPAAGLRLSWFDFADRVERLAAGLAEGGVRQGDRVATLFADGPLHNEAIFALARLGAVRVGLNYRYSPDELDTLVRHSGVRFGLCSDDFAPLVADGAVSFFSCGDAASDYGELSAMIDAGGATTLSSAAVAENDLSTICYTTGSTGAPKGALWTHRNVSHALAHTAMDAEMRPADIWLHCLPGAGVPGLLGIWHVVLGWTNVVLPAFTPQACLDAIAAHGVTATVWVPTMLGAVLDAQHAAPADCSSLRKVVYGSAPTTPAMIRRTLSTFPDAEIEQWYGSTEGAGGWFTRLSHADHLRAMEGEEHLLRSCGRPMHHVELEAAGPDGTALDPDEQGEIRVRSASVMAGYLDAPDLTAEALRDGWLHTGDLGYVDREGYAYLVDRKQFMIITGGYNVYPVEVENALAEHPAVADVCVFGVPDDHWGEAVHALVVLREGQAATPAELIEFSRGMLATFKVPKSVEMRSELLKGPTGKVLKREHKAEFWPGSSG